MIPEPAADQAPAWAAELLEEVRALRRAVEQRAAPRRSTLSRLDRATLSRLLPVIAGVLGSELFTCAELFALDAPGLRLVLESWTPKKLGRLLRRAADQPVDGLIVRREGDESGTGLWAIRKLLTF